MVKIVVLGSFNMDITVFADSLPQAGETVLGSSLMQSPGGKGSNQAIAAARLGAEVSFIGAVGRDAFGDEALVIHRNENVDTTYVARSDASTGAALIVVDSEGENQIAVAPGANSEVGPGVVKRAASAISEADVLIGQLETPVDSFIAAAMIAKQSSTTVVLNPAPFQPLSADLWPLVDFVTPNQHELGQLAGSDSIQAGADMVRRHGLSGLIVTQGSQGATLVSSQGTFEYPACVVDVVDTTGAGDAFTAGLAVSLADGDGARAAVEFALLCGAHAVTRRGVLEGLPTRSDVRMLAARH